MAGLSNFMADNQKYYPDGEYPLNVIGNCLNNFFRSEAEFCDFIEEHIEKFCVDAFGLRVKKYTREYNILQNTGSNRSPRVDFLIRTTCNKTIVLECKNPAGTGNSEFGRAVGQCLDYLVLFENQEQPIHKIVIVSTKINGRIPAIISKFNLPVAFIAMDRDKMLTYRRTESKWVDREF